MVGILDPLRHQVIAELRNVESESHGREAIERVFSQIADDDGVADSIWRSNLKSNLGGQLFIEDVELKQTTRKLTGVVPETFLNLAFTEAIEHFGARAILSPEAFAALQDSERFRAFTMSRVMSESIIANAHSLLAAAMAPEGVGLREFILGIEADEVSLGMTPNSHGYLENVYRTSTATSYNAGRLSRQTDPDVIASTGYWKYISAGDNRVRSSHAALDGKMWPINDPQALSVYPPNGYQCFPAGTDVQGSIVGGLRARYSGQLCKLTTESGRVLTVTPNHPLATPDGFAPAGSIVEGQHLLAYDGGVDGAVVGGVDVENPPTMIEEAFDALSVGDGPAIRLRPVPNDLHGDAANVDGDIEIVGAHGVLLDAVDSTGPKSGVDPILATAFTGLAHEVGDGSLPLGLRGLGDAPASGPSAAALPNDSGTVLLQRSPLHPLRLGPAATFDPSLVKPAVDDPTVNAEFIRELLHRGSGQVFLDEVVHVDVYPFHGYVYDLQSETGWIVASGIITSNCRCVMVTVDREDVDEAALNRSVDADAALTTGFSGTPGETIEAEASA